MKLRIPLSRLVLAGVLAVSIAGCASWQREVAKPADPEPQPSRIISDQDLADADRFLTLKQRDIPNSDIGYIWIEGGDALAYKKQASGAVRFLRTSVADGATRDLFDHQSVAELLSNALDTNITENQLPIDRLLSVEGTHLSFLVSRQVFECELDEERCVEVANDQKPAVSSPDGQWTLVQDEDNLSLLEVSSRTSRVLTTDGERSWGYGVQPEGNTMEIALRRAGRTVPPGAVWSPDSDKFISYRLDEREVPELYLVQSLPDDGAMRPKLYSYRYAMPGDPNAKTSFFLYDVKSQKWTEVDYPSVNSPSYTATLFSRVWWSEDGTSAFFLDEDTSAHSIKLVAVDAETGKTRILIEETSTGFIGANEFIYGTPNVHVLENGDFIWFSQRSGWGRLYLVDGSSGELEYAISPEQNLVRDLLLVDEASGFAYFTVSGGAGENIYHRKLYRAALDGSSMEMLTPEHGNHILYSDKFSNMPFLKVRGVRISTSFAPDGQHFVDKITGVDTPARWLLRAANGEIVKELAIEDLSVLGSYTAPEEFIVKSADGEWDLYGVLLKPADFDPAKQYPVIDNIYPGPQSYRTPTSVSGGLVFSAWDSSLLSEAQALADLGFVVMLVDGRGTPGRSKTFLDLSYGALETAGFLGDHVSALKQLAADRPYLDLNRVGIFGTSGGGFATAHAMLDYPDFYKVGVSSSGDHEMRSYLKLWGEMYQGKLGHADYDKVFSGYNAANLKGKLLIAHGELDDNVHPANTMRLVDALVKAGRQFDFIYMPNTHHGLANHPYFQRMTQLYFLRHLMGAEVPDDVELVPVGGYSSE